MVLRFDSAKKGVSTINFVIISLFLSIILIWYIFILYGSTNTYIEQKKVDSQIAVKQVFESKCFGEEYGIFDEVKFNEEVLKGCVVMPKTAFVKLSLDSKDIFSVEQEEFERRFELCRYESKSQLCNTLKFPILFNSVEKGVQQKTLSIDIITIN